jgi:twitching motility protein PilT
VLLEEMIQRGASDLHITAGERPKLRIDGEITNASTDIGARAEGHAAIAYSILTEAQKKRFETDDELDFSFGIANLSRFRGNVFKQRGCVSMAIRQIPFQIKTFDELKLPPIVAKLSEKPRGLVLVTGPTGSGKSTTLAAMIDKINREERGHILTVEDPIEFVHRHQGCIVNQREIGADTKSFGAALKYALRQDPDVVLIGEMRDQETIHAALTIAETGHLAFATLHTNSRRRRSTASSTSSRRTSRRRCARSSRSCWRASSRRRCCRGARAAAAWPRARSWSARPPSAPASATTRCTRSTRSCRPARSSACRR